jgi:hypothetical protein
MVYAGVCCLLCLAVPFWFSLSRGKVSYSLSLVTEAHACATGGAAASTLFLFLCELLLLYSSCFFLARGTFPTRLTKEGIFGIFYGAPLHHTTGWWYSVGWWYRVPNYLILGTFIATSQPHLS